MKPLILDPKNLRIEDFDYPLPDTRIAKYPVEPRDASKLLLYRRGNIAEDHFRNVADYLPAGELVVFNNTRVIYARLHFHRATGAHVEIFCLEPLAPADYQLSFAQGGSVEWACLIGNAKKWKGDVLELPFRVGEKALTLRAHRGEALASGWRVKLEWGDDAVSFAEVLDAIGELPIPPYLNRATEAADLQTYQTVYSKVKGSVAAPTAGLHFTPSVLAALDAKGVRREEITLHVGAGTFRPVKSDTMAGHAMHAEHFAVTAHNLRALLDADCACTAVGTTSVRTLESLYYLAVLLRENPDADNLCVPQWIPYGELPDLETRDALEFLLRHIESRGLPALHAATQIIIAPSYRFRLVKRLITNFHQPHSTLLLLVSAFVGDDWRRIYDYALAHDFRFLSYGDSSLLEP